MAQNRKRTRSMGILQDMGLTLVAVLVVGFTFAGVSGLTPRVQPETKSAVLGVSTHQKSLSYIPGDFSSLSFLSNFSLSTTTGTSGDATATLSFAQLEHAPYQFELATIKNTSVDYKKINLSPEFSLENSYTSVSVMFAGQTTEILTAQGLATPVDIVVPPNSASTVTLLVQPVAKLATPVTLTLNFTEVR